MTASIIPIEQRHELMLKAVKQIEQGVSLRDAAKELGISHTSLRIWLLDECPDEYKPAQRRGLIQRIAEADDKLDDAADAVSIARAREQAKFARWDAERRLPHLFGQKIEQTGTVVHVTVSNPTHPNVTTIDAETGKISDK
jgi:hypothetical protein